MPFFFFFFFIKVGYECRTLTRIKYFIWYHRWRKKIWVFFFLRFCPWAALTWHAAAIWWYISSKIHFFFFSFSLEHRLAASALARPRVTSSHILNLLLRNVSQAFLFYTRAPLWFFDASPVAEIGGSWIPTCCVFSAPPPPPSSSSTHFDAPLITPAL